MAGFILPLSNADESNFPGYSKLLVKQTVKGRTASSNGAADQPLPQTWKYYLGGLDGGIVELGDVTTQAAFRQLLEDCVAGLPSIPPGTAVLLFRHDAAPLASNKHHSMGGLWRASVPHGEAEDVWGRLAGAVVSGRLQTDTIANSCSAVTGLKIAAPRAGTTRTVELWVDGGYTYSDPNADEIEPSQETLQEQVASILAENGLNSISLTYATISEAEQEQQEERQQQQQQAPPQKEAGLVWADHSVEPEPTPASQPPPPAPRAFAAPAPARQQNEPPTAALFGKPAPFDNLRTASGRFSFGANAQASPTAADAVRGITSSGASSGEHRTFEQRKFGAFEENPFGIALNRDRAATSGTSSASASASAPAAASAGADGKQHAKQSAAAAAAAAAASTDPEEQRRLAAEEDAAARRFVGTMKSLEKAVRKLTKVAGELDNFSAERRHLEEADPDTKGLHAGDWADDTDCGAAAAEEAGELKKRYDVLRCSCDDIFTRERAATALLASVEGACARQFAEATEQRERCCEILTHRRMQEIVQKRDREAEERRLKEEEGRRRKTANNTLFSLITQTEKAAKGREEGLRQEEERRREQAKLEKQQRKNDRRTGGVAAAAAAATTTATAAASSSSSSAAAAAKQGGGVTFALPESAAVQQQAHPEPVVMVPASRPTSVPVISNHGFTFSAVAAGAAVPARAAAAAAAAAAPAQEEVAAAAPAAPAAVPQRQQQQRAAAAAAGSEPAAPSAAAAAKKDEAQPQPKKAKKKSAVPDVDSNKAMLKAKMDAEIREADRQRKAEAKKESNHLKRQEKKRTEVAVEETAARAEVAAAACEPYPAWAATMAEDGEAAAAAAEATRRQRELEVAAAMAELAVSSCRREEELSRIRANTEERRGREALWDDLRPILRAVEALRAEAEAEERRVAAEAAKQAEKELRARKEEERKRKFEEKVRRQQEELKARFAGPAGTMEKLREKCKPGAFAALADDDGNESSDGVQIAASSSKPKRTRRKKAAAAAAAAATVDDDEPEEEEATAEPAQAEAKEAEPVPAAAAAAPAAVKTKPAKTKPAKAPPAPAPAPVAAAEDEDEDEDEEEAVAAAATLQRRKKAGGSKGKGKGKKGGGQQPKKRKDKEGGEAVETTEDASTDKEPTPLDEAKAFVAEKIAYVMNDNDRMMFAYATLIGLLLTGIMMVHVLGI